MAKNNLNQRLDALEMKAGPPEMVVSCFNHTQYLAELKRAERRKRPTRFILFHFVRATDGISYGSDGVPWPGVAAIPVMQHEPPQERVVREPAPVKTPEEIRAAEEERLRAVYAISGIYF